MKTIFLLFFIISAAVFTISCERAVLKTASDTNYNPDFFTKLTSLEDLPENISKVISNSINNRNLKIENFEKFKLPYFLIPEKHLSLLFTKDQDGQFIENIKRKISGDTYIRFFIHPDNTNFYENLKASYRFIDQTQSNYMAATHHNTKSLLVWNIQHPLKEAFIMESITNPAKQNIPRTPASFNNASTNPISITFITGAHKNSGQEIIKLQD